MTALIRALVPLLVAAGAQFGISWTETDVEVWVNIALWVIAFASMLSPSFKAWMNHKEDAE